MIVVGPALPPRAELLALMLAQLPTSGRYAAGLALAYALLAGVYIFVSSQLAAKAAASVEEMARIETIKGVVYVLVTASLVFAGALWAMRRMERDATRLRERELALLAAESRVFAGLMASSVAHDVNNVLVTVLAEVDELVRDVSPEQRRSAEILKRAVNRLVGLNQRLVQASKVEVARERQPIDLVLAARQCVDELRSNPELRRCAVEVIGSSEFIVMASPLLVQQMLSNLVLNAAQATTSPGQVQVRVDRCDDDFVVEVHDNGPGVPESRRANLFGALVTTKPNGNGLGLFSVRACAESLGGSVEVDGSPLGGALFRIRLPSRASVAASPQLSPGP